MTARTLLIAAILLTVFPALPLAAAGPGNCHSHNPDPSCDGSSPPPPPPPSGTCPDDASACVDVALATVLGGVGTAGRVVQNFLGHVCLLGCGW